MFLLLYIQNSRAIFVFSSSLPVLLDAPHAPASYRLFTVNSGLALLMMVVGGIDGRHRGKRGGKREKPVSNSTRFSLSVEI